MKKHLFKGNLGAYVITLIFILTFIIIAIIVPKNEKTSNGTSLFEIIDRN